jgi:hypothetical protein
VPELLRPALLTASFAAPFKRAARDSRRPSGGGVEEAIVPKGAMPRLKARHPDVHDQSSSKRTWHVIAMITTSGHWWPLILT